MISLQLAAMHGPKPTASTYDLVVRTETAGFASTIAMLSWRPSMNAIEHGRDADLFSLCGRDQNRDASGALDSCGPALGPDEIWSYPASAN